MKRLKYKINNTNVKIVKSNYYNNGALYLGLVDCDTQELYCDITVNLNLSSETIIELNNDFLQFVNKKIQNKIVADLKLDYLCDDYNGFCRFPVYYIETDCIKNIPTMS